MRAASLLFAGCVVLSTPAMAEGVFDDARAMGRLVMQVCVPDTLDFATAFAATKTGAKEAGLNVVSEDEKVAMFGNPGGAHFVFTREIDAMACSLRIPAETGTEAYYKVLEQIVEEGVKSTYPKAMSIDAKKPSPHEEKHDWVYNKAKDRHFAATLSWNVERGVQLGVGFRQEYE